jgi:O-antigen ligase/type II secretory pathway pseudopilin PulG
VKSDKKFSHKRETSGEATVRGLELGAIAIAITLIVSVPVVLDPAGDYSLPKFEVLMGLSAALLVAVLGVVVLRRESLGVPVLVPALAFLGASALSALFSEDPWHSLFGDRYEGLLTLAAGVLLFYALARFLNSPLRVRVFLAAGVAAAVLVSIYGIFQRYGLDMISGWGNPWYTNPERATSTLGHPIALAAYLTLMMGAATALCFKKNGSSFWRYQASWLFALAVMGACWIYTDTRGAWLGATVALPVVLWFSIRKMGTLRPLLVPLATVVVAMAATVVAWSVFAKAMAGEVVEAAGYAFGDLTLPLRIQNIPTMTMLVVYVALIGAILWLSERGERTVRFLLVALLIPTIAVGITAVAVVTGNLASAEPATAKNIDANSELRLHIWRDTLPMILDSPLLGYGPDNFQESFKPYIGQDLETALTSDPHEVLGVDRAHNHLLQLAATTGLLGLAAYLWVFVSYFRNVYRRGGWPLIALSGGVLAYFLQLQTGIDAIDTSVVFWAILGVSVALMRLHDREEQSGAPNNTKTLEEDESVGTTLTPQTPRGGVYELGVVVLVVGVLVAIAVPTFLNQREKAAETQPEVLMADVEKFILAYNLAWMQGEPYPEAGVYTKENPIKHPDGSPAFTPSAGVTISTATTCGGGFTVEGESTTLAGGTFRYSYASATATYTSSSPDTSLYPDISDGLAGENMNSPSETPTTERDASARDGLVLAFLSNQSVGCTGHTTSTIEEVVFHARSGLTANLAEPAMLELKIDGVSQGTLEIPGTTLSEHRFELPEPLEPGVHTFEVAFTNDYYEGGEDRNLYVDHLTFA